MSALVPSKDENIERTDPLSPYYPKKELGAFRRLENGSVFALLNTLEKAPVTHVRTSSEDLDDVILPKVPDEIEYEREDESKLIVRPVGLSLDELALMMLMAGKFGKGEMLIESYSVGPGWAWLPPPTLEEKKDREERARKQLETYRAMKKITKPRRRIPSPHSEVGAQGRRLEDSGEIEVLEP